MIIGTTNLVINEIGAVFNVRIEGDTDANLFYTDATNSRVGVGTISPAEKLDVVGNIKLTGNVVISNGQGIDFSATAGTGTSELLADYEEGTWTPVDASSAGLTFTAASGRYVKIGRYVFCAGSMTYPVTASAAEAIWGGLPFNSTDFGGGTTTYCEGAFQLFIRSYGGATMGLVKDTNGTAPNVQLSGASIAFTYAYQV